MQSKGVSDVRKLINSGDFASWFRYYSELSENSQRLTSRVEDLISKIEILGFRSEATHRKADEILFLSGELEDKSQLAQAEYAEIENSSFEQLSTFESQRRVVNDCAIFQDQVEDALEKARLITSGLTPTHANAHSVQAAVEDFRIAQAEYERELERRDELWAGVEKTWSRAFLAAMARPEHLYQSRKIRSKAENCYSQAEAQRARVEDLEAELQSSRKEFRIYAEKLANHREMARATFNCVLIQDFLFWPNANNPELSICVPLVEERNHLNLQVEPLVLYQVSQEKGLEFIEPIPIEELSLVQDSRLDNFFVTKGVSANA